MDFRRARETEDPSPAIPDTGLIPIDFAHLVDALERAQRQSAAAVAEAAAANRSRSSITISDNALMGLEAMTPRSAQMLPVHCPASFHDRVAEIVRTANASQADTRDTKDEINAAVTECSSE